MSLQLHSIQNSCITPTLFNKSVAGFVCIASLTALALSVIGLIAASTGPLHAIVQFGATNHGVLLGASIFVLSLDLVWITILYTKFQRVAALEECSERLSFFDSLSDDCIEKISHFDSLPEELQLNIFSHLNEKDLKICSSTCKKWKRIAKDEALWKTLYPIIAFGKEKWTTYFGDVEDEPPLPPNIHQILKSRPHFLNGKSVEKTHWLILMPKSINGKPFTIRHMGELSKSPRQGHKTTYGLRYFYPEFESLYWDKPIEASYWVLISKDTLPKTGIEDYSEQVEVIKGYGEQLQIDYQIPYALEASVGMFTEFVLFGKSVSLQNTTRCQEKFGGVPIMVGYLNGGGLEILSSRKIHYVEVAGVLRMY